jgi:hypothetical protein
MEMMDQVPAEVLAQLPSRTELESRAQAAADRVKAALEEGK